MRRSIPHEQNLHTEAGIPATWPALALLIAALALIAHASVWAQAPVADEIHWTVLGPTAVTFDWRGSATTIRFGRTTTYDQEVTALAPVPYPFSSAGPFWEARISGLLPGTTYHYSIGDGLDHTFATAPVRGTAGFTVMVEGDIGSSLVHPEVTGVQALIAAEHPAFVLAVGDLTYGDDNGVAAVDHHFNDMMAWSQDVAYMPAWGNHEWGSPIDDLRNYKGRFDLPNAQTSPGSEPVACCGEDWYWFDYGNARFIAFPEPWTDAWADWFTQASTLMDQAEADPAIGYVVTFGHRPAYAAGTNAPGNTTLRALMDTLGARHSKYVLDLSGHDHNYHRSTVKNHVTHVVAGIGGRALIEVTPQSFTAFGAAHHGAVRLRFTPTAIEGAAICGPAGGSFPCTPGSTMDSFVIPNPDSPPPGDRPPVVTAPAGVHAHPDIAVTTDVTVSDPDGDPIDSLTAHPGTLSTRFDVSPDNRSGRLTWTPGTADTGLSFPISFTASNQLSTTATSTIEVGGSDRPPIVTAPDTVTMAARSRTSFVVRARDPDGDLITALAPGFGALPAGNDAAFVAAAGDSAGTCAWTPAVTATRSEPYPITFLATNVLGGADTTWVRVVAPVLVKGTLDKRVAAGADDAEENASGSVSLSSSDLELVNDGNNQVVGMRFTGIAIPPGAHVDSAYVQFSVDETGSLATTLALQGQAADSAPAFTSATRNVSSRSRTTASVPWSPATWAAVKQAGAAQRTPDLSPVLQQIVDRAGWRSGNALVLIVTGTGRRTAEAFEVNPSGAPLLHVAYSTGPRVNQPPVVDAGPDLVTTLPAEAILDGTVTDDGLPTPALAVTWTAVAGPGTVTFTGGATAVDARASFLVAGSYTLSLTAVDGELTATDSMRVTVNEAGTGPPASIVVEKRVSAGADDAEENASGSVSLSSSDLELVNDGTNQVVGMRFTGLAIPPGARIDSAYVQFKVDETGSLATALTVQGQATDIAAAFTSAARNVSGRARTTAAVPWAPAAWTAVKLAGSAQRTPDLAAVIQEIVNRAGWQSGNALALIVTGTGRRTAESFEVDAPGAPLLHVKLAAASAALAATIEDDESEDEENRITADSPLSAPASIETMSFPPIRGALGVRVAPNPVRGEAVLQLVTAHIGPARADLYDAAGRRVRTLLATDELKAGPHTFRLDAVDDGGRRLAAGVYFYRVEVSGGAGRGRFLVLE